MARGGRHVGGGNFMFALLSMILLEFACRICAKDLTGRKLTAFTSALESIERRYFTRLPGPCVSTAEFTLPGSSPGCHLLGMMFDLIRNGKAHQYQSAVVTLSDGQVDIDITGAACDRALRRPNRRRPRRHLRYKVSNAGDLSLYIRTDQLFLDIKKAIENSGIISATDVVVDIARPRQHKSPKGSGARSAPARFYNFTVSDLEECLNRGGHKKGCWGS